MRIDVDDSDDSSEGGEFEKLCNDMLKSLKEDYEHKKGQIHALIKLHKKERPAKRVNTGFTVLKPVPEKLEKLLGYPANSKFSRSRVVKDIHNELKKRDLILNSNGRVYRADTDFRKTFGLPKSVNESTDEHDENGFNFFNLQKHVKLCYDNDVNVQKDRTDIVMKN